MEALEGYVMPLEFDVPQVVSPNNLFDRVGDRHVQWLSRRQQAKFLKRREKAADKHRAALDKMEEKRLRSEQDIASLEDQLLREQQRLEYKLSEDLASADARGRGKLQSEHQKRVNKIEDKIAKEQIKTDDAMEKHRQSAAKKLQKPHEKEEKIARKIRWVVVRTWTDDEDDEGDGENEPDHSSSNTDEI